MSYDLTMIKLSLLKVLMLLGLTPFILTVLWRCLMSLPPRAFIYSLLAIPLSLFLGMIIYALYGVFSEDIDHENINRVRKERYSVVK